MDANRYAEVVSTGDEFLVEESNELVPATVLNAATFQMKGDIEVVALFTIDF